MRHLVNTSLRTKLLLCCASLLVALLLAELSVRCWYGLRPLPPTITYGADSDDWRQRWIQRRRDSGVDIHYTYDRHDPQLGWALAPNLQAVRHANHPPVTTNGQGWRSRRDFTIDKPPQVTRIIALGDSFTFGEEVGDDDPWPAQLESQLDNAQVYNMGVHGYGTDQQLIALEEYGLRYNPDIVVLGFFVEDIVRNGLSFRDYAKPMFVLRDGELVLTGSPVPSPRQLLPDALGKRPFSYIVEIGRRRLMSRPTVEDVSEERDLFSLTRAILQRLADRCDKLVVVVIPSVNQPSPKVQSAIARWALQIGYVAVDLREPFDRAEKQYGRSMYGRAHLNALGHFVAARSVRTAILQRGWVSPPQPNRAAKTQARLAALLGGEAPSVADDYNRARRLVAQKQFSQALPLLRQVVQDRPDHVNARLYLGNTLRALEQFDEAVTHYEHALRLEPDNAEAKTHFGHLHYLAGRKLVQDGAFDRAIEAFGKARQLRPNWHAPVSSMAAAMLANPDDAARQPQKALQLATQAANMTDRRDPLVLDVLAEAHAANGDPHQAVAEAKAALKLTTNARFREHLQNQIKRFTAMRQ